MKMRNWHRWFGAPAALFFFWLAVTGIALQFDLWIRGQPAPGAEARANLPAPPLPDDAAIAALATTAAKGYREVRPGSGAQSLTITFGEKPRAVFATKDGPEAPRVQIDPLSGAKVTPPKPRFTNYHNFLQDLHAGYAFGTVGRVISVLLGLSLLVLSVTGFKVYLDLYLRRRKLGKPGPFWK